MNSRSLLRILAAIALIGSLGGCASLSKSECMNANWEDIGIRDGANGRPEEYLIEHSTACAKVNVKPDRQQWLRGRERGLERFCEPHRMYAIGEGGGGLDAAICRNFDQDRLSDAYEKGREVNRRASALNAIDNEMREINARLADKDKDKEHELGKKERDALVFRLGVLTVERVEAQHAYDEALARGQSL